MTRIDLVTLQQHQVVLSMGGEPTLDAQCEYAGCDSEHRLSTEARGVKR
jgi:hypothetical protein